MKGLLGKIGKVDRIDDDGDLSMKIDGRNWSLNPKAVRVVTPASEVPGVLRDCLGNPSKSMKPA